MASPAIAVGTLVFVIGVADSINPSTVGPAVALAVGRHGARRAAAFTAGVALVSFAGGAILVLGPGAAIMAAIPRPSARFEHIAEIVLGVVALVLAAVAWRGRRALERRLTREEDPSRRSGHAAAFGLGAGIMAVELPTAFPYFGAVAAIIGAHVSPLGRLGLVFVYNVAFVLPLLAIIALRIAGGHRLDAFRVAFARYAGATLAALLAVAGVVLLVLGITRSG
jgi:cytochrome c biogenesis protein CcdA